jgi:WD40 repeat protein
MKKLFPCFMFCFFVAQFITAQRVSPPVFNPDGSKIAILKNGGIEITTKGSPEGIFLEDQGVTALCYTDNENLILGDKNGRIATFSQGKIIEDWESVPILSVDGTPNGAVSALAYADGNLAIGFDSGRVEVKTSEGYVDRVGLKQAISAIAFTSTGNLVLITDRKIPPRICLPGTKSAIDFVDPDTTPYTNGIQSYHHDDPSIDVFFTTGSDGIVRIFSEDGKRLGRLERRTSKKDVEELSALAISKVSKEKEIDEVGRETGAIVTYVYVYYNDGFVTTFKVARNGDLLSGEEITSANVGLSGTAFAFSPDLENYEINSIDNNGELRFKSYKQQRGGLEIVSNVDTETTIEIYRGNRRLLTRTIPKGETESFSISLGEVTMRIVKENGKRVTIRANEEVLEVVLDKKVTTHIDPIPMAKIQVLSPSDCSVSITYSPHVKSERVIRGSEGNIFEVEPGEVRVSIIENGARLRFKGEGGSYKSVVVPAGTTEPLKIELERIPMGTVEINSKAEGWTLTLIEMNTGQRYEKDIGGIGRSRIDDIAVGTYIVTIEGNAKIEGESNIIVSDGDSVRINLVEFGTVDAEYSELRPQLFARINQNTAIYYSDDKIRIWSDNGQILHTYHVKGEANPITALNYDNTGKFLLIGFNDGTISFLEIETSTWWEWDSASMDAAVTAISCSDDGHTLIAGSHDGLACIWQISRDEINKQFSGKMLRPLSVRDSSVVTVSYLRSVLAAILVYADGTVRYYHDENKGNDRIFEKKIKDVVSVSLAPNTMSLAVVIVENDVPGVKLYNINNGNNTLVRQDIIDSNDTIASVYLVLRFSHMG